MKSRELQLHFDLQAIDDSNLKSEKRVDKINKPKQIEDPDNQSKSNLFSEMENSPTPNQNKGQHSLKIYSNDKDLLYFQKSLSKTNNEYGNAEIQQRILYAQELKKKGNLYYSDKKFEEAISLYTEALFFVQDNVLLLLNRAIAYIKVQKFDQAIQDCTLVLQIVQSKEERSAQIIDSFFKAHLRRALAYYKTGQLLKALQDVKLAIQIDPSDKDAQQLKIDVKNYLLLESIDQQNKSDSCKVIEEQCETNFDKQPVQQIQNSNEDTQSNQFVNSKWSIDTIKTSSQFKFQQNNLNYKNVLDAFFLQNQHYDLFQVLQVMRQYTDKAAAYFYDNKGIETLITIIKTDEEFLHDQYNFMASLPALILQCYQEQNQLYQEQFILQYNGVDIIIQKIIKLLNKANQKKKSAIFDCIRDYIEAINIMNEEKTRILIQSNPHIITTLYPEIFIRILSLSETEYDLVSSFLSLCANLCYDQTSFLRQIFFNHFDQIIDQISQIYQNVELSQYSCDMYVQLLNLLSNLLIEDQFRKKFKDYNFNRQFYIHFFRLLKQLQINLDPNYDELISISLGFLINLFHQTSSILSDQLIIELKQLPKILEAFTFSRNSLILERVEIVQGNLNIYRESSFINLKLKNYLLLESIDQQNKSDSCKVIEEQCETNFDKQPVQQIQNSNEDTQSNQFVNSKWSIDTIKTSSQFKFQQNNLNYKNVLDAFFLQNQHYDLFQVLQVMRQYTDKAAAYFYDNKGIETLITIIKTDEEFLHDQYNFMASLPALILQCYQEQNQLYQEQFILQYNGVDIIIQKIIKLLNKANQKKKSAIFDCIRDYIEAINIMNEEKTRILIQSNPHIITTLYPEIFIRILSLSETEYDLVSSFLSLCANLCYDQTSFLRQIFFNHFDQIIDQISQIYQNVELSQYSCDMYVQLLNLLSNLLIEDQFRKKFKDYNFNRQFYIHFFRLLKQLQINLDPNYDELISISLGFLINLFHQTSSILSDQLIIELKQLPKILEAFTFSRNSLILERVEIVQGNLNIYRESSFINLKLKVIGQMKNVNNFH
ncbi:unnamed protein product [Paramecium sonneborni]|uniref:Tetratricopeptide repeat protein n=1 Tax=Paramecium sonneborni TaxID=65129 RepID=A0A8S1REA8_9CILI|nr:unnamed protein product [Paramecium sonneborni]